MSPLGDLLIVHDVVVLADTEIDDVWVSVSDASSLGDPVSVASSVDDRVRLPALFEGVGGDGVVLAVAVTV